MLVFSGPDLKQLGFTLNWAAETAESSFPSAPAKGAAQIRHIVSL